jgi:type III pantothenate kinase
MSVHVLAVDVGNSRFKVGLFEAGGRGDELPRCLGATAVPLADEVPWHVVDRWRDGADTVPGVVAGANPAGIRKVLATWPRDGWGSPVVVDDPTTFPLETGVDSPGTVGIDRLLNAVAANVLRGEQQPAIVVDTGTATTVDVVSSAGQFEGGAILPGFELAARSLHQYTALLPLIPVAELDGGGPSLGRNTRDALRSGLYFAQLGAVRELVREFGALEAAAPLVLLTGGGAALLEPRLEGARLAPHLTLQGLVLVAGLLP